jgi:hypothetical protein
LRQKQFLGTTFFNIFRHIVPNWVVTALFSENLVNRVIFVVLDVTKNWFLQESGSQIVPNWVV